MDDHATVDHHTNETEDSTEATHEIVFYSTPSLICGIVMILVAFIGILGNAITAIVFSFKKKSSKSQPISSSSTIGAGSYISSLSSPSPHLRRRSHPSLSSISILVTGLACVDAILLSLSCPLFASSAFYAYNPTLSLLNAVSYMTVYAYPLASIFQTASVWILSIITIERYIAVCHPFLARAVFTPSRALWALGAIAVISMGYNAPRFWEYCVYRIEASDDPDVVLIIALPTLRSNVNYMRIYGHWMYFVFIFALPFAILVFFNGGVVRAVRLARCHRRTLSRQQTKEQGTAVMMVSVAVVFLACNLLAFVLNALEVFGGSGAHRVPLPDQSAENETSGTEAAVRHSSTFYLLVDFNNLLVMLHCSINFFIYYNFSERFRIGFYRLLRRWIRYCLGFYCRKLRRGSSFSDNEIRRGSVFVPSQRKQTTVLLLRRYSSRCSHCRSSGSLASGRNLMMIPANEFSPICHRFCSIDSTVRLSM